MIIEVEPSIAKKCVSFRHVQAILLFLGVALAHGIRVNMSIAMIPITTCPQFENGTEYGAEHEYLDWKISTQGIILSSFAVGYVITQAAGYYLATKFGGKLLMVVGVAVSSTLCAFIPLGAYYGGWMLVCLCRGIQGLAQGAMIPAIHHLFENWIPAKNKRLLETLVVVFGMQFGTAFHFLISGFIIKYLKWESTFYMCFVTGFFWSIAYIILGSDSAETSKYISEDEKLYIKNFLIQDTERRNLKMPWHAIWKSLPVLSLVLACCAQQWGMWTFITMIPIYLNAAYKIDIDMIGVITAVPFAAMVLMLFPFRCISDCLIKKSCLSATVIRKIFNTIGFLGPVLCLSAMRYLRLDLTVTAVLLIIYMAFNAAQFSGFMSSHVDMAPNFGDTLKRTTIGFADVLAMFAPVTAGGMLEKQSNLSDWSSVFNLSASLYVTGGFFYIVFGSSEEQRWNVTTLPANEPDKSSRRK